MEKVIIELFERIMQCEEKLDTQAKEIKYLKDQLDNMIKNKDKEIPMLEGNDNEFTRSEMRSHVIKSIKKKCPQTNIRVAKRSEGSGIVICIKDEKKLFKFYHSKSYKKTNSCNAYSWNGISIADICPKYSGYIFAITTLKSNETYILFFTYDEFLDLINRSNKKSVKDRLHFSFQVNEDLSVYEVRDESIEDVSNALFNYEVINN